jgi:hypothetical protein
VTYTDHDYTDVTVNTRHGQAAIASTAHHLYWDATTHTWTEADHLRVGDSLQASGGAPVMVLALRDYTATMVTYNLTIDTLHTYYVEAHDTPVLVHNTDDCQLFPNTMPQTLGGELAAAKELGVKPAVAGSAGFDAAISSGAIKWAVLEDGTLVVEPKFVNGVEISHAVLSRGAPVRAAGEADVAGSADVGYIGLDINYNSGHFLPSSGSLQVGVRAFAAAGVQFR